MERSELGRGMRLAVLLFLLGLYTFVICGCVFGLLLLLRHVSRKEQRRYRAIVETPTTPIAQVTDGSFVELQGRALASERGRVRSPLSGQELLGYHIDIRAGYHMPKRGIEYRIIEKLRDRREFWLDDGSGQRAWIVPHDAEAVLPTVQHGGFQGVTIGAGPLTKRELSPEIERWARQQSGEWKRRICVEESVIEDGALLYVLGWASVQGGVTTMANQPRGELMLSTLSEQQLIVLMARRSKWRAGMLLGCGGLTVIGLVLTVVGALLEFL